MKRLTKFQIAIIIGVAVVFAVAYLDIMGANFFRELGVNYTEGDFPVEFWHFFRNMTFIFMAIPSIAYYYFYRRDKSEAVAIFLVPFTLWMFGAADFLYFIFQLKMVPEVLPWLDNHMVMGRLAKIFNFSGVTNISLYLSVIVGIIITYFTTKFLKNRL